MRGERGEIVVRAGLLPDVLAQRRGARQLLDQRLRQLDLLVVLAAKLADRGAGVAVRVGGQRALGQLAQPLAQPRIGAALVDQPGQKRHLLGAILAGRDRQHRPFVPTQHRFGADQVGGFAGMLTKLLVDLLGVRHGFL